MIVPRHRFRHLAAAAGWIGVILPLTVVLLSLALSPASPWTVRTALAGFCILAIARPDAALLVTVALVGFGNILSHLAGVPPLRAIEVLVAGSLVGFCVRALPPGAPFRRPLTDSISMPVALFAIATVASTLVWQRVSQFETGYASAYLDALWRFASRDYFVQPGRFAGLVSAAVLVEGLALFVVVASLCRVDARFFERALRMLAAGGAGLAVMSVVRLAEILLRNPDAIGAVRATSIGLRISPQIPDYIAAGSYFALCWLASLGLAIAAFRTRLVWVAAGVPLIAALYLTGSRSVIAAALVGLGALVLTVVRQRKGAARGVVVFAALAVAVMIFSYRWMTGRDVAGEMAMQSLTVRVELVRTGLSMIATRPLFGIGIDRFFVLARGLASPELRALWGGRMNPHNDFLRFGAELGLVGLGLFLWILAAAGGRIWRGIQRTGDARLAGLAGGLIAFLVTSLVSNPLMVRDVSYVFWIALGLAVGHSAGAEAPRDASGEATPRLPASPGRFSRFRWPLTVLLGGLLILSVPLRARKELASTNLAGVSYGFFEWGTDPDGTPFRLSGPHSTFFVDGGTRLVEIPLSGGTPSGVLQQVEVRVNGRLANRVAVGPEWQPLRMLLPAGGSTAHHRIDLTVSPSWVPAEVFPRSRDRRARGVKVGKIKVIIPADQGR